MRARLARDADRLGKVAQRLPASRRAGAARRSSACGDRPTRSRCPSFTSSQQLALAEHRVVELEARELGLLGRPLEAGFVDQPVVDVVVVLELERAERVRDALDGVGQTVREVVERIQAPRVAAAGSAARAGSGAAADRA